MPKQVVPPPIRRKLLALYDHFSQAVDKVAHEGNPKTTCTKGCAHCCHMMTAITMLEGAVLAENVMLRADWRDIALRARADALVLKEHWNDRVAYLKAYSPCPLLDQEKKECLLYNRRPSVCRFHFVVSDPELCGPQPNGSTDILALDLTYPEAQVFRFCITVTPDDADRDIIAPISLMLLHWLPALAKTEEDRTFLVGLSDGIMTAREFASRSLSEEGLRSNTPEALEAIHKSFTKVFTEKPL